MKQGKDTVDCNDYIKVLNTIPRHLYPELAKYFNVRNVSIIFKGRAISKKNYEKLLVFMPVYNKKSFSFVGDPVEFDIYQQSEYLQALNRYIGSVEFMLQSTGDKNNIIEEQKRMSKYLSQIK